MQAYKQTIKTLLALAMILVLAACGGAATPSTSAPDEPPTPIVEQEPAPVQNAADLDDTKWILASLNGEPPVEGPTLTLDFHHGTEVGGFAGCNHFGGSYSAADGTLTIGDITQTLQLCEAPAGVMEQETDYLELLANAARYTVTDGTLEIQNEAGETILTFTLKRAAVLDPALVDAEWVLASLNGNALIEGTRITLSFMEDEYEGRFGGFSGCNSYGGTFTAASEGRLGIGETALTAMFCTEPEGVSDQESRYLETLGTAPTYTVTEDRLEVQNSAGETVLVFARQEEATMDPAALLGTAWQLESLDGSPIEGTPITLTFINEGIATGNAGCRTYVFAYEAEGDDIDFPMMSALGDPACVSDEPLMQHEGRYTDVFSWANHYRMEGETLELLSERGETLTFSALPHEVVTGLAGTAWRLSAFIQNNEIEGSERPMPLVTELPRETDITMRFEGGSLAGSAGCNGYFASYQMSGDDLTVEGLGWNEMFCETPEGIMELEQQFLSALENATTFHVAGGHLWLQAEDGSALLLAAQEQ